jgi:SRSO17 transposase
MRRRPAGGLWLYLPQAWASDGARREKAGVPDEIAFKTKPEIALDQIRAAAAAGLPRGAALMDAGYGVDSQFRSALSELGLRCAAGVLSTTYVWPPANAPLPPKPSIPGRGRPTKRLRRDAFHQPAAVEDLALGLPAKAWRTVPGGWERTPGSVRASPACASAPPVSIASAASRGRRNGY